MFGFVAIADGFSGADGFGISLTDVMNRGKAAAQAKAKPKGAGCTAIRWPGAAALYATVSAQVHSSPAFKPGASGSSWEGWKSAERGACQTAAKAKSEKEATNAIQRLQMYVNGQIAKFNKARAPAPSSAPAAETAPAEEAAPEPSSKMPLIIGAFVLAGAAAFIAKKRGMF